MNRSPDPQAGRTALYFDDLRVGQRFDCGSLRIDEEQIKAFARQYDPQLFHTDPEAAKATFFGGLVASGWHTASLTMRLLVENGPAIAGGLIGAGGEINWPRPTRPGDLLLVEFEVTDLRTSQSNPRRGMATIRGETRNDRGELLQVLIARLVVPRKT